ncbi:hypothetical protein [Afifella sp. IM 167]|uniref:hypothetical protein n=1 Tax=Afifella sp. IM 167 TaxID=2033586 RepID=UPI001CCB89DC|nr:hypothetical protein [Afifella sp. IM 167]MBZ8134515.1 hypothetical protein [Afifella sp. IM 167]
MKTAIVLMTLLGCDCDASQCLVVDTLDTGWRSVAECRADIAGEVASRTDAYPTLVATCETRSEMGPPLNLALDAAAPQNAAEKPEPGYLGALGRSLGISHARRGMRDVLHASLSTSSTAIAWLGERIGIPTP